MVAGIVEVPTVQENILPAFPSSARTLGLPKIWLNLSTISGANQAKVQAGLLPTNPLIPQVVDNSGDNLWLKGKSPWRYGDKFVGIPSSHWQSRLAP
jgi:hypothetical protein